MPELCEGGSPAGAKEVYSEPSAHIKSEPSNPTGFPAGAKEVYSEPSAHIKSEPSNPTGFPAGVKEVYSAPSTHLKTLEGCSTHHTVVLT